MMPEGGNPEREGMTGPGSDGGFFRSETGVRVLSGLALVVIALGLTYQGGAIFALLWFVAGVAIFFEWTRMVDVDRRVPTLIAATLALLAYVLSRVTGMPALVLTAIAVSGAVLVVLIPTSLRDRIWAGFGYLTAFVVVAVPIAVRFDPLLGAAGIIWIFAVVWGTDIAAYFTGRKFGGPKLWPSVSPKKTWSGFFGGLIAGTLAGTVTGAVARTFGAVLPFDLLSLAVLSAFASVLGQLGDLAESAMKRRFHVKDSSNIIPGHGGVMDRLDAFAAVCLLVGALMIWAFLFGFAGRVL
jgi:phosphatidate cytidylyltransferase